MQQSSLVWRVPGKTSHDGKGRKANRSSVATMRLDRLNFYLLGAKKKQAWNYMAYVMEGARGSATGFVVLSRE